MLEEDSRGVIHEIWKPAHPCKALYLTDFSNDWRHPLSTFENALDVDHWTGFVESSGRMVQDLFSPARKQLMETVTNSNELARIHNIEKWASPLEGNISVRGKEAKKNPAIFPSPCVRLAHACTSTCSSAAQFSMIKARLPTCSG